MELLSLREAQVHLRESNVGLREEEMQRRRELEELSRNRDAIADQVMQLERARVEMQDQHGSEQRELERKQDMMKEKLQKCRDAVAFAVGSIDELYAQQEESIHRMSTSTGTADGDSMVIGDDLQNAKAQAQEAGAEVVHLLNTLDEEPGQENSQLHVLHISNKKTEERSFDQGQRSPLRSFNVSH